MKNKLNYSSEAAVDPQSGKFLAELIRECSKLKLMPKVTAADYKGISNAIKQYTNLSITIADEDDPSSLKNLFNFYYMCSPNLDNNHIFIDEFTKYSIPEVNASKKKAIRKEFGNTINGSVSLTKGWVDGDFTKFPFRLNLPPSGFTASPLKPEHIAAIILHEVGHAFTNLQMMDQVVTTNQVLFSLLEGLTSTKDLKERTYIIDTAYKRVGVNNRTKSAENLAKKSDEIATKVFLTQTIVGDQSLSSSFDYDMVSCEQMADQFAARHGAGFYLAECNDYFEKHIAKSKLFFKSKAEFNRAERVRMVKLHLSKVMEFLSAVSLPVSTIVGTSALSAGAMGAGLVMGIGGVAISLLLGLMSEKLFMGLINTSGIAHYLYDKPRERAIRIKEDLINQLKEKDKPKEYYLNLVKDIKAIEEIINGYYEKDSFLVKLFTNINRLREEDLARELESLAANDLFVKAQQFKFA